MENKLGNGHPVKHNTDPGKFERRDETSTNQNRYVSPSVQSCNSVRRHHSHEEKIMGSCLCRLCTSTYDAIS